jgi:hypothetical protein
MENFVYLEYEKVVHRMKLKANLAVFSNQLLMISIARNRENFYVEKKLSTNLVNKKIDLPLRSLKMGKIA